MRPEIILALREGSSARVCVIMCAGVGGYILIFVYRYFSDMYFYASCDKVPEEVRRGLLRTWSYI